MAAMRAPACPNCRRRTARRCRRTGAIDRLASLAYVYPFRCEVCSRRFYVVRWRTRYERMEIDRRMHERVEIAAPIVIGVGGHRIDGVTDTVSLGGCGVLTAASLNAGDVVTLEIGDERAPIVADAIVASVRSGAIGFAFTRVMAGHARRLATLLAEARSASDARRTKRPRLVKRARPAPPRSDTRVPRRSRIAWLATLGVTAAGALALAIL
jgi:PilZ domain-containing protein